MGWMAELAGKTPYKGKVVVTNLAGETSVYVDLEEATGACGALRWRLRYHRGAFVETAPQPPAVEPARPRSDPPTPTEAPRQRRESNETADDW